MDQPIYAVVRCEMVAGQPVSERVLFVHTSDLQARQHARDAYRNAEDDITVFLVEFSDEGYEVCRYAVERPHDRQTCVCQDCTKRRDFIGMLNGMLAN